MKTSFYWGEIAMNQENSRRAAIDTILDEISRAPVPPDVESRLRARLHEICQHPEAAVPTVFAPHRMMRFFPACVAAGLAASVLMAVTLVMLGGRDAWAQVVKTVQSKPWVRCTLQVPVGAPLPPDFQPPEGWFSAKNKIGARRFMKAAQFVDFARQEAREYDPKENSLSIASVGENENKDFGLIAMLLRLVSEGAPDFKLTETPIELVERAQRDVREGDRRWIEFTFKLRDSRRTPKDYSVTVRVDPQSRLPIDMVSTEKFTPDDKSVRTYVFDYPLSGPADIYALGVPRDAIIVDRRRPKRSGEKEIKELLAAYAKARQKSMPPYTAVVLVSGRPDFPFSDVDMAFQVQDDGGNRHITQTDQDRLMELRKRIWSNDLRLPDGIDPATWWKQEVANLPFAPLAGGFDSDFRPDGAGDLLLGDAILSPNDDRQFTLDRHPTSGPAGTILLRIRVDSGSRFNDIAYWIAPERGYIVLRREMTFSRNPADSGGILTWTVDKVEQAPGGGRWYATEARQGIIEKSGDDLSADLKPRGAVTTTIIRFLVDFTIHPSAPRHRTSVP